MSTLAETLRGRALYLDGNLSFANGCVRRVFTSIFSWSKPVKTAAVRHAPREFHDYLDGYFNSFDFYPVCTRQAFVRNDAYALWLDFMKVAGDFSKASERLVNSPEQFLKLGAISGEKLEKLKRQAARQSVRRAVAEAKDKD